MSDPTPMTFPSYAAATFCYGIQVEPESLIFSARARELQTAGYDMLERCAAGSLQMSPDRDRQTTIRDLPPEVIANIGEQFRRAGLAEASCKSWMYFGPDYAAKYHPEYCCKEGGARPMEEWPSRILTDWTSARDEFLDHFTSCVPRCLRPCNKHHVCTVVHQFLQRWNLCLADCPFGIGELEKEPVGWLITSTQERRQPPHFEHFLNLDTDDTAHFPFRNATIIPDDWQEKQVKTKGIFARFRSESGVSVAEGTSTIPAFHLICIGEKLE